MLGVNRGVFDAVEAVSPSTRWICRYVGDQDVTRYTEFQERLLTQVRDNLDPRIVGWEGMNEAIGSSSPADVKRGFMGNEWGFARRLYERYGKTAFIGGISTGGLDANKDWAAVAPTFEDMHKANVKAGHPVAVFHFHEYSGPYMQYMVRTLGPDGKPDGRNQWDHANHTWTGFSASRDAYFDARLDGWLLLRYRMLWRLIMAAGLTAVRFFVSESGIDDVNPRPGPANAKGWRDFDNAEWTPPIVGDYADQLYWYAWQLSQDPYVLGAVDFGFGTADSAWNSFDLSQRPDMLARVTAAMLRLPVGSGGFTPPVPVPDPVPAPEPEVPVLSGIDVSEYQGWMDWTLARRAAFCYVRAGGAITDIDNRWSENATSASRVALPWGPYWYFSNTLDGAQQARAFAATVGNRVYQLPPGLDCELGGVLDHANLRRCLDEIERLMGRPLLYTSVNWLNVNGLQLATWLRRFPLWLARYTSVTPPAPAPYQSWAIWQHSSTGMGAYYGATGNSNVDQNRFMGTLTQLLALRLPPTVVIEPPPPVVTPPTPIPALDIPRLKAAAEAMHLARGIHFNPTSGLQRTILADGFAIATNEEPYVDASGEYQIQVAQLVAGGATGKRVYVWDKRTGKTTAFVL